jgi:hypothetical protein
MLLILLAWLYITVVCFTWGILSVRLIAGKQALQAFNAMHWPVVCLTGLALTGVLSFWLSVFMPIGLAAHLIILIPVILYHLSIKRIKVLYQPLLTLKKMNGWLSFLLISTILLVLLMASYKIDHPDTLKYQGPAIRWMETYKAIPGIVHFNTRLAYQSWWFSAQALFRFSFISANNFLFVNSCILFWFLVFVVRRIGDAWEQLKQKQPTAIYVFSGWLLLLGFSFLSWTQLRLTAVSTSPDFIAMLYAWFMFYLFYQYRLGNNQQFLAILITLSGCAAVCTKLSVVMLLLLPAWLFIRLLFRKNYKTAFIVLVIGSLIIAPTVIRSVINTGYPLYPSTYLDIFHSDWKASPVTLHQEANYISAYARFPVGGYTEAERVLRMPYTQWIPIWWAGLTAVDKTLLLVLLVLLVINIVSLRKRIVAKNSNNLVILLVALAGSLFWFLKAPATRFGAGFLVPLFFSLSTGLYYVIGPYLKEVKLYMCKMALIVFSLGITSYIAYRAIYFFEPGQLAIPLGIEKPVYQEIIYKGIPFYFTPPCTGQNPPSAVLRGSDIKDGFKEK